MLAVRETLETFFKEETFTRSQQNLFNNLLQWMNNAEIKIMGAENFLRFPWNWTTEKKLDFLRTFLKVIFELEFVAGNTIRDHVNREWKFSNWYDRILLPKDTANHTCLQLFAENGSYNTRFLKDLLRLINNVPKHHHEENLIIWNYFQSEAKITEFFLDKFDNLVPSFYHEILNNRDDSTIKNFFESFL